MVVVENLHQYLRDVQEAPDQGKAALAAASGADATERSRSHIHPAAYGCTISRNP